MKEKDTTANEIATTLGNELNNQHWTFGGKSIERAILDPEGAPKDQPNPNTLLITLEDGSMYSVTVEWVA
jgi:hypothetical protein